MFSDADPQELGLERTKSMRPALSAICVLRGIGEQWLVQSMMIRPSSLKRVAWDISSFLFVGYDSFMIPLQLVDPPPSIFFDMMLWITRFFWTLDIAMTCLTGYTDSSGAVVMAPGTVVRRYLRTWCVFDLMVVGLDWAELLISSGVFSMSWARFGKATRFFRIARMLRLLRLARVQDTASTQISILLETLQSEKLSLMMDIMKLTVMLLGIGHLLACIWYGIGASPPEGEESWITDGWNEAGFLRRYSVSLHWALSQFQGGMDEVRPHNVNERLYAICSLLLGFLISTAVIGRLTSSMTQLYVLSSHNSRQVSSLRKYLKQNLISRRLAFRIHRNALHALAANESVVQEQAVELLAALSEPLRAELHFELYSPCFGEHGLFRSVIQDFPEVMSRICHQAISISEISSGDPVFHMGERPMQPKTYIVSRGQLQYVMGSYAEVSQVQVGAFISEAVLWTHWTHAGLLVATSEVRLTALDAEMFMQIVDNFSLAWQNPSSDPRKYAAHFVVSMNELLFDEQEIDDLFTVGIETPEHPVHRRLLSTFSIAGEHIEQHSESNFDVPRSSASRLWKDAWLGRLRMYGCSALCGLSRRKVTQAWGCLSGGRWSPTSATMAGAFTTPPTRVQVVPTAG